jgi:hypothetical protein
VLTCSADAATGCVSSATPAGFSKNASMRRRFSCAHDKTVPAMHQRACPILKMYGFSCPRSYQKHCFFTTTTTTKWPRTPHAGS